MRRLATMLVFGLGGCDDSFRQVGPGDPRVGDTADTGATGRDTAPWHCDRRPTAGTCEDYVGDGWDADAAEADCGADSFAEGGCPPSDLGGCDETLENPLGTIVWYYQGQFWSTSDAGFLESQCVTAYFDWLAAR